MQLTILTHQIRNSQGIHAHLFSLVKPRRLRGRAAPRLLHREEFPTHETQDRSPAFGELNLFFNTPPASRIGSPAAASWHTLIPPCLSPRPSQECLLSISYPQHSTNFQDILCNQIIIQTPDLKIQSSLKIPLPKNSNFPVSSVRLRLKPSPQFSQTIIIIPFNSAFFTRASHYTTSPTLHKNIPKLEESGTSLGVRTVCCVVS